MAYIKDAPGGISKWKHENPKWMLKNPEFGPFFDNDDPQFLFTSK
jgi:hypothetical protein